MCAKKRNSERDFLQTKKKRDRNRRKINGLYSMISGRYSQTTHLCPKSKVVLDPGKGSYQLKKLRNRKGYQTEEIHAISSNIAEGTFFVLFEILDKIACISSTV